MNPNEILIHELALDASRYLTNFLADPNMRISDDDTDYLPALLSMLTHAITALTADDPADACADLILRCAAATDDNDPDFLLADAITCPFSTALFNIMNRD